MSEDGRHGMFVPGADIEAALWKGVAQSSYEGLIGRFAATEAVAADLLLIEIDLTTYEPVRPEWIDPQHMTKHFHGSRFAGASEINDVSPGAGLPIQSKLFRERPARWLMVMATPQALSVGSSEAIGECTQGHKVLVMTTHPNLLLPQPVKVFDHGLKASLQGWCEDRSDSER